MTFSAEFIDVCRAIAPRIEYSGRRIALAPRRGHSHHMIIAWTMAVLAGYTWVDIADDKISLKPVLAGMARKAFIQLFRR